jgi:hypothetical protein
MERTREILGDAEMVRKSPASAGFQLHCRSSLTLAHINFARWQPKKMWLQSSSSPHRDHLPSKRPWWFATCSLEGKKILIIDW